jgi:hypothetical protein
MSGMKQLMKKLSENKKLTYMVMFSLFLIIVVGLEVYKRMGGDWVELKTKDFMGGVSSYDKKIAKGSKNTLRVKIKTLYTGEGRDFFVNFIVNYISRGSENGLDGFSYVINADELNCSEGKYRILSTTLYDENDKVLYTNSYQAENWKDIPSHSDLEELTQDICK